MKDESEQAAHQGKVVEERALPEEALPGYFVSEEVAADDLSEKSALPEVAGEHGDLGGQERVEPQRLVVVGVETGQLEHRSCHKNWLRL